MTSLSHQGERRRCAGFGRGLVHSAMAFILLFVTAANAATDRQPHELVSDVVGRVMDRLSVEEVGDDGQIDQLLALFEQELSPHFAFATISRWIAGPRWQSLTKMERDELQKVVHDHIVHAYASLLARGHSAKIVIDDSSSVKKKSARVGGQLAMADGRDLNLEFRLLRGSENWKLYDLTVDGLSFARSLKAELHPILQADGIAGLRAYLSEPR